MKQGCHDVGALIARRVGDEASIVPTDMGANVVAAHSFFLNAILNSDRDLRFEKRGMPLEFAQEGSAEEEKSHRS